MEVFEQFYIDSKLGGEDRSAAVEKYASLSLKSNLFNYVRFHLDEKSYSEVDLFVKEIMIIENRMKMEKRLDWLEDENN